MPLTSSAARLLAPRQIEYTNLEVFLSLLYKKYRGTDTSTLLFNSGYHANTGLISAIADRDTLIVADKLVHASIIDGITADIERLIALKRQYPNVMLYVDEAHAFGVLGPKGLGLSAASSAPHDIDIIVGTFGKAAASMGAFAIVGLDMHDYLVNTARSFIFSTALPPMSAAWTRFTHHT